MKVSQPTLKLQHVPLDQITASFSEFNAVATDMFDHAGPFMPTPNWVTLDPGTPANADAAALARKAYAPESFERNFSSLEKVLVSWIGQRGLRETEDWLVRLYGAFHESYDPIGLWAKNVGTAAGRPPLRNADLSSIVELTLLHAFAGSRESTAPTLILEIGGGYGRLAEAALNVFGTSVKHVLVDAVPASLIYAHKYLTQACPARRIGSHYAGDPFDLEKFDAYIVPSWYFEERNSYRYDICVNIDSFQEMSQALVDRYLGMFDAVVKPGGIIYNSNGRASYFAGKWNFPPHWRRVFCSPTPRPWFENHPSEIFVNAPGYDYSHENEAVDAAYVYQHRVFRNPFAFFRTIGARQVIRGIAGKIRSKVRSSTT